MKRCVACPSPSHTWMAEYCRQSPSSCLALLPPVLEPGPMSYLWQHSPPP